MTANDRGAGVGSDAARVEKSPAGRSLCAHRGTWSPEPTTLLALALAVVLVGVLVDPAPLPVSETPMPPGFRAAVRLYANAVATAGNDRDVLAADAVRALRGEK